MDLTPGFNELLKKHDAPPSGTKVSLETVDAFLEEARRINSHITNLHRSLLSARRAYLSRAQPRKGNFQGINPQTSFMSDEDRELLDKNAKDIMRDANWSIEQLEGAEKLRYETQKKSIQKRYGGGLGALSSWASGGIVSSKTPEHQNAEAQAEELRIHRDGVVWYLRRQLQQCGKTQSDMMEKRLRRELEQTRSLGSQAMSFADFAQFTGTTAKPSSNTGSSQDQDAAPRPNDGLTDEQIQMFEAGNQDMMTHFESMHEKVRTAQKSLAEISDLQTTLISHLSTQAENIELLVEESQDTTEKVQEGNKQLKKATERPSAARLTFYAASGLCTFLVIWDLVF